MSHISIGRQSSSIYRHKLRMSMVRNPDLHHNWCFPIIFGLSRIALGVPFSSYSVNWQTSIWAEQAESGLVWEKLMEAVCYTPFCVFSSEFKPGYTMVPSKMWTVVDTLALMLYSLRRFLTVRLHPWVFWPSRSTFWSILAEQWAANLKKLSSAAAIAIALILFLSEYFFQKKYQ